MKLAVGRAIFALAKEARRPVVDGTGRSPDCIVVEVTVEVDVDVEGEVGWRGAQPQGFQKKIIENRKPLGLCRGRS